MPEGWGWGPFVAGVGVPGIGWKRKSPLSLIKSYNIPCFTDNYETWLTAASGIFMEGRWKESEERKARLPTGHAFTVPVKSGLKTEAKKEFLEETAWYLNIYRFTKHGAIFGVAKVATAYNHFLLVLYCHQYVIVKPLFGKSQKGIFLIKPLQFLISFELTMQMRQI